MNIAATQVDLQRASFEFYVSGCNVHCPGCQNAELWDFSYGKSWKESLTNNLSKITMAKRLLKKFVILGGEPLQQNLDELAEFVQELKKSFPELEIWLFTSFEFEKIPESIKSLFNVIKTGQYIQDSESIEWKDFGYTLASKNQKFFRLQ